MDMFSLSKKFLILFSMYSLLILISSTALANGVNRIINFTNNIDHILSAHRQAPYTFSFGGNIDDILDSDINNYDMIWRCSQLNYFMHSNLLRKHISISSNNEEAHSQFNETTRKALVAESYIENIDPLRVSFNRKVYIDFIDKITKVDYDSPGFCEQISEFYDYFISNDKAINNRKEAKNILLKDFSMKEVNGFVNNKNNKLLSRLGASIREEYQKNLKLNEDPEETLKITRFKLLNKLSESEYIDSDIAFSGQALMKSYLQSLDKYSDYYDEALLTLLENRNSSSYAGLGVSIRLASKGYKIVHIVPGGPADKDASLNVGDIIIGIDGVHRLYRKNERDIFSLLSGRPGSKVKLDIVRNDLSSFRLNLTRETVLSKVDTGVISKFFTSRKNNKLGYMKIKSFYYGTKTEDGVSTDVKKHMKELIYKNINGLIIDLRGNSGGSTIEALKILGFFLGENKPVLRSIDSKNNIKHQSTTTDIIFRKPLLVLINNESASSSEILAGNLQDYRRAVIVGSSRSYGKGVTQSFSKFQRFTYPGGYNITTSKHYLASGRSPHGVGVIPNINFNPSHQLNPPERVFSDLPNLFNQNIIQRSQSKTKFKRSLSLLRSSLKSIPLYEPLSKDNELNLSLHLLNQWIYYN